MSSNRLIASDDVSNHFILEDDFQAIPINQPYPQAAERRTFFCPRIAMPAWGGQFLKGTLSIAKAVTAFGGAFFSAQSILSFLMEEDNTISPPYLALSLGIAVNSLAYTLITRSVQMVVTKLPETGSLSLNEDDSTFSEAKSVALTSQEVHDFIERKGDPTQDDETEDEMKRESPLQKKFVYRLIVGLSIGSQFFSALASYNGVFTLLKTINAIIISSAENTIDDINRNPSKFYTIQTLCILAFVAQLLSYKTFQSKAVEDYLQGWWFTLKKCQQINSYPYWARFGLALCLLITIGSTTFFGMYSTEKGLENFNKAFFEPVFGCSIPSPVLQLGESLSAVCLAVFTSVTAIPSTFNYLAQSKNKRKRLSNLGKFAACLGIMECVVNTVSTFYGSVNRISKLSGVSEYNSWVVGLTAGCIIPTSFYYTLSFSTFKSINELYSIDHFSSRDPSLREPLLARRSPSQRPSAPTLEDDKKNSNLINNFPPLDSFRQGSLLPPPLLPQRFFIPALENDGKSLNVIDNFSPLAPSGQASLLIPPSSPQRSPTPTLEDDGKSLNVIDNFSPLDPPQGESLLIHSSSNDKVQQPNDERICESPPPDSSPKREPGGEISSPPPKNQEWYAEWNKNYLRRHEHVPPASKQTWKKDTLGKSPSLPDLVLLKEAALNEEIEIKHMEFFMSGAYKKVKEHTHTPRAKQEKKEPYIRKRRVSAPLPRVKPPFG